MDNELVDTCFKASLGSAPVRARKRIIEVFGGELLVAAEDDGVASRGSSVWGRR